MISLVNKGSYRSYGLLLVIVMLGASLAAPERRLLRANSVAGIHHSVQ